MSRRSSLLLTLFFALDVVLAGHEFSQKCSSKNLQWTGGSNVDWPCMSTKALYKNTGKYVSKNVIATRVAIHKGDTFLALPRYRTGVPMTLARISATGKNCQTSLSPFPCWGFQEEGNCAVLQSVVDIFLDTQGILWALDTGIVNSLEEPVHKCPPKVVAFNAKTGKVVKTVDISPLVNRLSRLQYVVADYSSDGRAFIYVSDAASRAILVFDVMSGRGYRVILPTDVTNGCTHRDILYLALIRRSDGTRCLIFTYLSNRNLFSIKTSYLQNGSAEGKIHNMGAKRNKVVFLGTDNGSSVFFRKEDESDVYKWNLADCTSSDNIVKVYRGDSWALPTQVVSDYQKRRMRLLESNFPDFFQGTIGCGINHALKLL